MKIPKVNLEHWNLIGSTGSVLVFESRFKKNEYQLFPVAIVFDDFDDVNGRIVRARSYKGNPLDVVNLFTSSLASEC